MLNMLSSNFFIKNYFSEIEGCMQQCIEKSKEIKVLGNKSVRVTNNIFKNKAIINIDSRAVTECRQIVNDDGNNDKLK